MHLVADISSHGYGHLAQAAPVLNRVAQRLPAVRMTVRTTLPERVVGLRLRCRFALEGRDMDVGIPMRDATRVDLEATRRTYEAFHEDWEQRVAREAQVLETLRPDLLFADVPYLSLAAAARAGVPAVAMCSLNWLDIYLGLRVPGRGAARRIVREMESAHACASLFLAPEPSMPMPALREAVATVRHIGPVADPGRPRRAELAQRIGVSPERSLVLVSMGGVRYGLRCETWPAAEDLHFIVPDDAARGRGDMTGIAGVALPFPDLFASVDAVVTKPGYGSFVEAACGRLAVAYVRRERWPEEPALVAWLQRHTRCIEIDEAALQSGGFLGALRACLAAERVPPIEPAGVNEAAAILAAMLSR